MHCASCERRIEEVLKGLPGVEEVEVSLKKQKAGVRFKDHTALPDIDVLNQTFVPMGYRLVPVTNSPLVCQLPGTSRPWRTRFSHALGAFLVVGLVWRFFVTPLMTVVTNVSVSGALIALFIFGMIASLSTCLASTGAYLLAYAAQKS